MYPTSTQCILVGLDLSSTDEYFLSFLAKNAQALTEQPIQFIHVEEAPPADEATEQMKTERLRDRMAHIKQSIPAEVAPKEIDILPGDPETEIKKRGQAQSIDLLVLGQKPTAHADVAVERLVRKSGSSLLLLPEQDNYRIGTIGIAIDFSPLSKMVVQAARDLAQSFGAKLVGFHTYQVPTGYHKTGKSRQESAEVMENNARKEASRFLADLGLDAMEMHYRYDQHQPPAEEIADFARETGIDLLVVGSKGRTNAADLVLGSVAKKLTQTLKDIPTMIIKKKHENMDLLDALKEL